MMSNLRKLMSVTRKKEMNNWIEYRNPKIKELNNKIRQSLTKNENVEEIDGREKS